jgi:hypothetical protein
MQETGNAATMTEEQFVAVQRWFNEYCEDFRSAIADEQRNYDLKKLHTHQVCANISTLVQEAGLGERWSVLARTCALLHDVGRFRQYCEYRTFKDSVSVNHAALGARVVTEAGVLADLPAAERELILQAVRLHNVMAVPNRLAPEVQTLLALIRDADKLDIWRVFIDYFQQPAAERASAAGLGFPDLPHCSPAVVAALGRREVVQLSMLTTLNDFKLLQLSWVFDLNWPASFALAHSRGYIPALAATLPATNEVRHAISGVTAYCEQMASPKVNDITDEKNEEKQ